MIEMKLEDIIYKKNHVNLMETILLKQKFVDLCVNLILNGLKSMKVGWNSIEKDVAYCLYCYLFRQDVGMQFGGDSFVTKGFNSWNKKEKLDLHVGGVNSANN